MELDIFAPQLSLAIEYQGEQHYKNLYPFGELTQISLRDEEKRRACVRAGITLIEIPYWWNFEKDSLSATIQLHRPELIHDNIFSSPIPTTPPIRKQQQPQPQQQEEEEDKQEE